MMLKKISIIIPIYNVESYVGKTLESVFQTTAPLDSYEVIVVNDGTKDGSMNVVRRFENHPSLAIVEQENQGLSAARMKGLSMATGEYVWFIDSDDYLVEDGVGKVLNLLSEMQDVEVLMFPLRWVYEDGRDDWVDYKIDGASIVDSKTVIIDLGLPMWASPRFVFKRSLTVNEFLIFPYGLLHEDEYFGRVLISLAGRIGVMTDPVYMYRIRSGSITASLTIRSAYDLVSIYKSLMLYMEQTMASSDWEWFRPSCFKLLQSLYKKSFPLGNTLDFHRFAFSKGYYVWRQWLAIHPEKKLKNKLGRLFFYMFPRERGRLLGK